MILITNMFQLYVDCFALYLIMSFTKEKRNSMEQTSYDRLLRRDVPNMVFIRNQQILDEYLKGEIEDQEKQRKLMILQSQINLYLHSFNCENLGISLDMNIYSGFIQINRSDDHTMSYRDSDFNSVAILPSESNELSILVRQQLDKFKEEYIEEETILITTRRTSVKKKQALLGGTGESQMYEKTESAVLDYSLDEKLLRSCEDI